MTAIAVPDIVRSKAQVAGADAWLCDIDQLIADVAARWELRIDGVLDGATEALVLAVTRDNTPAVAKLCIPRGDNTHAAHEAAVLELAGGVGCVELLDADLSAGVLLLERLGPSLADLDVPIDRRRRIMCDAATAMWRTPAGETGFVNGAAKARWLIDAITSTWERLGRPCPEAVIDHAVHAAERRIAADDPERSVLVHGDVHQWNTLAHAGGDATGSFKLIDPDGLIAEPEYDLGIIMREDPIELRSGPPRDVSRQLAEWTSCNEIAIWEWGVVERVSTGLLCVEIGLQPVGSDMLTTAAMVIDAA